MNSAYWHSKGHKQLTKSQLKEEQKKIGYSHVLMDDYSLFPMPAPKEGDYCIVDKLVYLCHQTPLTENKYRVEKAISSQIRRLYEK